MFTDQIVPIAKIAIEHSEFHTLDYLLSELYNWMQGPDESVAKDVSKIGHFMVDAIDKDPSLMERYAIAIGRIQRYLTITIEWIENGKH